MDPNPPPLFPPELEREIFETAAYFYPETIQKLLLVSHRVYKWLDGMQYATVMAKAVEGSCPVDVLLREIQSESRPASFFHDHVRHLYVINRGESWDQDKNVLIQVLSACCGIHNLVLFVGVHLLKSLLPSLAAMKLRRLVITGDALFFQVDPETSMFSSLTHLYLPYDPLVHRHTAMTSRDRLPSFLAHLPVLTHFAMVAIFSNTASAALAKDILVSCKNLQVLIVGVIEDVKLFPSIDDARFLVFRPSGKYEFDLGWVAETRGGIDFWARADAFVAKKQRGEIQPSSRCWIEFEDGIPAEGGI
ncbi:hypothetical protein MSAN_00147800 [Mycena sanguinolenta]|uniref:Uncharacterized protein n=1 Tax=Mycena sanguinolenta TaxID=230812 RepID=A0A8H7DK84_9AGAR|nr:hypothetical protein MSAN_00147800 [Mycena sanguinolenta]